VFPKKPNHAYELSKGILGVLPGIIGCIQANEVIKIIAQIGEVLTNKMLIFNALKMNCRILNLEGNISKKVIT